MKKIKLNFRYCYGIKKLEKQFDFRNRIFSIYAPNGSMKTSFAKTFDDYSKGRETKDMAFPERITVRKILADDQEMSPESIFVIEPYNQDYQSDKISTLLADKELKKEYEEIHKDIDKIKNEFIKKLKQLAGLSRKDSVEDIVEDIFKKSFFDLIIELEDFVSEKETLPFHDTQYSIIFNEKVLGFLNTKDFKNSIKEYIQKYDELLEKSQYLNREFNFYHAGTIQKQLEINNFFRVGHSVNLFDGNNKKEFPSGNELKQAVESERKKVLSDDDLKKRFDEIDKKLGNADLRAFRSYLLDNQEVLPELVNLSLFQEKIWLAYFVEQKTLFFELLRNYKAGQEKIKELVEQAIKEKTEWEKVIKIFNTRFSHLPFYLNMKNKDDVILKDEVPAIEFIFKDGEDEKVFQDKKELLDILSTGERRALYILNIIFEVEARKKEESETLFIIDDIADSFDYKNKYAIIEYLKYMSEVDKFFMLIMTHNFDFFRTVESRSISSYCQCLIAIKNPSGIKLEQAEYLRNPFIRNWKDHLGDNKKLISSIPFVRNIIEYTQGTVNNDFQLLTSVLHIKDSTGNLTLQDIKTVFENNIKNLNFPKENLDKRILELIFETADECLNADEGINLENKIALSIAIRIKAEQFMKSKITDEQFLKDLDEMSKQTWRLLKKYEEEFNNETTNIEILKRVNLMTPENIHINSFMYEPILDMGDVELKELYKTVKAKLTIY